MKQGIGLTYVAAVVFIVAGGCSNNSTAVGAGGAGANLRGDSEFVHDVASKNRAAIELSRQARDRSTSPQIKAFAQMMIRDYSAADDKLKSTLSGQAIEWPTRLDDKHQETADELSQRPGAEFDRDYVKAMVEVQQNLAAILESRLDVKSLADWKTAAAGRTEGQAMPEPAAEMGDVSVRPNTSDNATTMKVNQWVADTYPVAQKGLDTARTLENATKPRS